MFSTNAIGCELHAVVSPTCPGILVTRCYVKGLSLDNGSVEIDIGKGTGKSPWDWLTDPNRKKSDYWKSTEIWNDGARGDLGVYDFKGSTLKSGTVIMVAAAEDTDGCEAEVTVKLPYYG